MSETDRTREVEWLARRLAEYLAADSDETPPVPIVSRDDDWAHLLGAAAVPLDDMRMQIEDVTALIVRILDFAVDEWLAMQRNGELQDEAEGDRNATTDTSSAEERPAPSTSRPGSRLADDRTRDELLWSLLVDNWRRVAPPFVDVLH